MTYPHQSLTVEEQEKEYHFSVITQWKEGTAYLSTGASVSSGPNDQGNLEAMLEVSKDLNGTTETEHSFSLAKTQVQAQTNPQIEVVVTENGAELGRTIHPLDSSLTVKSREVDPKGTTTGAKKIYRPWTKGAKSEDRVPKKKKRNFKRSNDDQSKD